MVLNSIIPRIQWSQLGYITYKRTYARPIVGTNRTEEWNETCDRMVNALNSQLKMNISDEEKKDYFNMFYDFKGLPAGRFIYNLGSPIIDKLGCASLMNCAYFDINNIYAFTDVFDFLLLGTGVGFGIQKRNIERLPLVLDVNIKDKIKRDDERGEFIIEDSREGFISFINQILKSYFITGQGFTYNASKVRPYNSPISTGGYASGVEPLIYAGEEVIRILDKQRGLSLRSVDCLDICCVLGQVAQYGGRRVAEIAIGDHNDYLYLNAKNWSLGNIPNYRAYSNNTIEVNDINDVLNMDEFWNLYNGTSEPYGLFNRELCIYTGRLKDSKNLEGEIMRKDIKDNTRGLNPCGEQTLNNAELCCLMEIMLPRIETYKELLMTAIKLYKIGKHSLMLPCHNKQVEKVIRKNMRIGIGITGILQCPDYKLKWLSSLHEHIKEFDDMYSKELGVNKSIKLFTVKPSGTVSLLATPYLDGSMGVMTNGVHGAYSKYALRRIRINSSHELVEKARNNGYEIEYQENFDGTIDYKTAIICIPISYDTPSTIYADELSAIDQLELIKKLQNEYSDNSVSCTVYYRLEELENIKNWLKNNYNDNCKSLSFLLHSDHGFKQAPYTKITKEEYETRIKNIKPISGLDTVDEHIDDIMADNCKNGFCSLK